MLKLAVFLAVVCFVACQDSEYELRKSVADFLMKAALRKMVEDVETKKVDGENIVEMKDDIINTKDPSSRRSYGVSDNAVENALRKMMEGDKHRKCVGIHFIKPVISAPTFNFKRKRSEAQELREPLRNKKTQ